MFFLCSYVMLFYWTYVCVWLHGIAFLKGLSRCSSVSSPWWRPGQGLTLWLQCLPWSQRLARQCVILLLLMCDLFFLRCDLIVVLGSDLMYLKWFLCFFGVISLCFLWSFDSPTQAFEEEGTRIGNAVPMLTLVTEKELHAKSACKVLYIYIYIYICMSSYLMFLCSSCALMYICSHALMTRPLWWAHRWVPWLLSNIWR